MPEAAKNKETLADVKKRARLEAPSASADAAVDLDAEGDVAM
jgi:hypothetical protein